MTLPRATQVDDTSSAADAEVLLDFQGRHRRRIVLTSDSGFEFLLDLPKARALVDGDVLVMDDKRRVRVRAQHEALLHIRAADAHTLMRIAWHLGNRHLAVAMFTDHIDILADHVIADMVQGLGGIVSDGHGVFQPESGAYAHEH